MSKKRKKKPEIKPEVVVEEKEIIVEVKTEVPVSTPAVKKLKPKTVTGANGTRARSHPRHFSPGKRRR